MTAHRLPKQEPGAPEAAAPLRRFCPFASDQDPGRLVHPPLRATLPSGQQAWVVAGYEAVAALLGDERVSSEHSHPDFPNLFPVRRTRSEDGTKPLLTYSGMDPPEHTRHRRIVARDFSIGEIERLKPRIREVVTARLQTFQAGARPADLVTGFAEPVTSAITTEMVGIPEDRRDSFRDLAKVLMGRQPSQDMAREASLSFRAMLTQLLAEKERLPASDVLGRLVHAYSSSGSYDRRQLVEFAGALITAGYETTVNMLSLGAVVLMEHEAERRAMFSRPDGLRLGVEELLRYLSIADLVMGRVTLSDLRIEGVDIPAENGILPSIAGANRDARVYPAPDRFLPFREGPLHLAFGRGPHRCLGQHLARAQLEIAFQELFTVMPDLRLAPSSQIRVRNEGAILGVEEVFVTW